MSYNYVSVDGHQMEVAVAAAHFLIRRDFKKMTGETLLISRAIVPTSVQQAGYDAYVARGYTGTKWAKPNESSHCEIGPNGPTATDYHDSGSDAGVTVKFTRRWNALKSVSARWGLTWGGWGVPDYEGWHWENRKVRKGLTGRNASPRSIKDIQTYLKKQGFYDLTVDGIWGNGSTAGTMAVQMEKGLTPDGIWGPATDAAAFGANPDQMEGVDFSWGRPSPAALVAAGKRFVLRYLGTTEGHSLTKAEMDSYTSAGLGVGFIYEETGKELLGGRDAGVRVAKIADDCAKALGHAGAVIYFNVDYDAPASDYPAIFEALKGVASVIGLGRTGLYAGYYVMKAAFDAAVITYGFQTYGWSKGNVDPRANIYQWLNGQKIGGAAVDYTRSLKKDWGAAVAPKASSAPAPAGVTPTPAPKPAPTPNVPWPARSLYGAAWVEKAQTKLNRLGYRLDVDGMDGPATQKAVRAEQTRAKITVDGIYGPNTDKAVDRRIAKLVPAFPLKKGYYFGPSLPLWNLKSVSGYFSHRADLKRWQQRMQDRGWKITVDGLYGPDTAAVARAFQKEKKLTVDGLIGAETWRAAWTEPVT